MKPYNDNQPKTQQIREMFDRIAPTYDRLNHLLSLGIDRSWRRKTVRMLAATHPRRVIDVATGTGDLALAIARRIPGIRIEGVDLSAQMIEIARTKTSAAETQGRIPHDVISYRVADVESLPFPDDSFDAATVAFGVRNFGDIRSGLTRMQRVLRPGGSIFILEFDTPHGKIFGPLYRFYFHRVLPTVGGWFSKDRKAYHYLPQSVDEFPAPGRLREIMTEAGFSECRSRSLFGGVAYIHTAKK